MISFCCLCLYISRTVPKPQLENHIPAATNTFAAIDEQLGAVFSIYSVPYQILQLDKLY
jgi:hypothetical protein